MIKSALMTLVLGVCTTLAAHAAPDRLVAGPERGTYVQVARDLSKLVAKPAGIDLDVAPSKGSTENVRRLRAEQGVRLAMVQSDVYQAFVNEAKAGDADAAQLIKPLRVVLPLYDEEIYFVTRADSPLTYIHEIKDKRINLGPVGSGTALTATTLYRLMFGTPIADRNMSFLSNEEALLKLATDRSIDVAVVVAGQPAKLFADMKQEARQYVKLLKLDPQASESQAATSIYNHSAIRSASYPNWLQDDVATLSTKALLVTYNYRTPDLQQLLTRFALSMCRNFDQLRAEGHAKWQEVSLTLPPLGAGWSYYGPTERILGNCSALQSSPKLDGAPARTAASCPQDKVVLGLCRR
ncbi:TAXI family TRAP transporter solute-binding subunit [Caldimonas brevitalea]|uniref:C4-dicarboxylate ABC transporter substrate-binding protein n=1 Tax=Caldimonas brevitalea TaxID=413882 RepID=A0A0G3BEU0_9BURK|nr:TAXI family TRAP transporter solute-binding subunit [Caldimonas brevitalea]AKJ27802.1 C4-dicarboxylate ABC transporter substrate-binding protein [Caldimonas brevitalea]